jgi:hypothetical protein
MFLSSRDTAGSALCAAMWFLVFAGGAEADFDDKQFEARLIHTLDRQATSAITLGRQASYAALGAGSLNPAAASWPESEQPAVSLIANYVDAASSSADTRIGAAPVTVRWSSPTLGTTQLSYAHTRTRHGGGLQGLRQGLASDEYTLAYGRPLTDAWAAGVAVRVTDSQIDHEFSSPELGGRAVRATTRFVAPDVNVGVVGHVTNTLTMGAVISISSARPTTELQNVDTLLIPSAGTGPPVLVLPRTTLNTSKDRFWYYALGLGAGYRPCPDVGVYVDVRAARSTGATAGTVDLARAVAGVEHRVNERWSWRAGISMNTQNDVTTSFGLSYRFGRNLDLAIAWQNNASPEVNPELGRTRLIAASLGVRL